MALIQQVWNAALGVAGHGKVVLIVTATSVIMIVGSILLMPIIVCKLPADYFNHEKPHLLERIKASSPRKAATLIVKNFFGTLLLLAGFLMLFLPGQGLLTILIGLILIDFPGKYRLERRIAGTPKILQAINWLREKRGVPKMYVSRASK